MHVKGYRERSAHIVRRYIFIYVKPIARGEEGYITGFGRTRDLWRCHFRFCTARRVNHSTNRPTARADRRKNNIDMNSRP